MISVDLEGSKFWELIGFVKFRFVLVLVLVFVIKKDSCFGYLLSKYY